MEDLNSRKVFVKKLIGTLPVSFRVCLDVLMTCGFAMIAVASSLLLLHFSYSLPSFL